MRIFNIFIFLTLIYWLLICVTRSLSCGSAFWTICNSSCSSKELSISQQLEDLIFVVYAIFSYDNWSISLFFPFIFCAKKPGLPSAPFPSELSTFKLAVSWFFLCGVWVWLFSPIVFIYLFFTRQQQVKWILLFYGNRHTNCGYETLQ